jgi:RNA polymerase sigma-70 factor (ECF subfamily)
MNMPFDGGKPGDADQEIPTSPISSSAGLSGSASHAGLFPTTQWNLIRAIRDCPPESRNDILNYLIKTYWKPLYYYARRKGHDEQDAQDLVQGFFTSCIERGFFARADRRKARFRTFLRVSFDNFAKNVKRAENAKFRKPPKGVLSLDEVMAGDDKKYSLEPRVDETPEDIFNRVWARELMFRVLRMFKDDCRDAGHDTRWHLFNLRIIKPNLEGGTPPSLEELARQYGLTPKQAANCLLAARRGYQRLLRETIRMYAFSENDAAAEMQELQLAFD